jgi:hypothetical protein
MTQGCNNIVISWLYRTCWNNLETSLIISTKLLPACSTLVDNLGQAVRNNLLTACWQSSTRCAIFTRVHYGSTCTSAENNVLNQFARTFIDIIFLWYWFLLYTGWIRNLWWFERTIWVLRSSKLKFNSLIRYFSLMSHVCHVFLISIFFPASVKYVWPGCDIFSYWISGDCICFVFGQMFWSSARCHRYTTTTPQCAEIKAHFHSGKFSAERRMCKMWLADTNFQLLTMIFSLKIFNF